MLTVWIRWLWFCIDRFLWLLACICKCNGYVEWRGYDVDWNCLFVGLTIWIGELVFVGYGYRFCGRYVVQQRC